MAAQGTGSSIEAVRNGGLVIRERDVCKLGTGSIDGVVDHVLRFVFQLVDGRIFGDFCCGVGFSLAGVGAFLTAE